MEKLESLRDEAIEKAELSSIDKDFAFDVTEEVVSRHETVYSDWEQKGLDNRSSERKQLVKAIRRRLREVYGVFFTSPLSGEERDTILEEPSDERLRSVMERHLSTRERLPHYPYLLDHFSEWFESYDSVLDIGCGYNPLSIPVFNHGKSVSMIDISNEELSFVSNILTERGIANTFETIDVSNPKEFSKSMEKGEILFKKGSIDVALCFKLLDSLETKNRGASQRILEILSQVTEKGLVVSFAKRTVSGRHTIDADRDWFYDILDNLRDHDRKDVETINETLHLIRWT